MVSLTTSEEVSGSGVSSLCGVRGEVPAKFDFVFLIPQNNYLGSNSILLQTFWGGTLHSVPPRPIFCDLIFEFDLVSS